MNSPYPIRAVAKITGISLDTLRAWERRYQAVVPERSERGRLYSGADIERLILLNRLVQNGHAISGVASLDDEQLKALLDQEPGPREAPTRTPAEVLTPVLAAIENFDSAAAGDELSRLAAVLNPRDLVYQVAVPLMHEVGVRWHNGTFAIAQEHLVSELLRNLFGSLMHLLRPSRPTLKIVLATPAGEAHDFGILAAAMLASIAGAEPVFLGADLPALQIAEAAQRVNAQAILLGITVATESMTGEVTALAATMPDGCELWVGGASSTDLDLSGIARMTVLLKDLPAFENECRRWRR